MADSASIERGSTGGWSESTKMQNQETGYVATRFIQMVSEAGD